MYNFLSLYEYFSSRALSDTEKPQCLSVQPDCGADCDGLVWPARCKLLPSPDHQITPGLHSSGPLDSCHYS